MLRLENPFPDYIGFAVMTRVHLRALSPQEGRLLSARASEKRRREFVLGRHAAAEALRLAGMDPPPPVLREPDGSPRWPAGYVGTITHCKGIAASAVCPSPLSRGVGIDLEDLSAEVSPDTYGLVCTPEELSWVEEVLPAEQKIRFLSLFSAKEAGFKAFFPQVRRFIDFRDARLRWDPVRESFVGELVKALAEGCPEGYTFEVGSRKNSGLVLSFVCLPAPDDASGGAIG